MHDNRLFVLVAASLFCFAIFPAIASGGEFGIPCDPGSASESGFPPCTPCAPGTFTPFAGAAQCDACPAGMSATSAGAAICVDCNCNDATVCTNDSCAASTGQCSAEPVPDCALQTVSFEGTVTSTESVGGFPDPGSIFQIGTPFEGYYVFDPAAPDASPSALDEGTYIGAVQDFAIRVGSGAGLIESVSSYGTLYIDDEPTPQGDSYTVQVTSLTGPSLPGLVREELRLTLRDEAGDVFSSDAIPPFAEVVSIAAINRQATFAVSSSGDLNQLALALSGDFLLSAPEPTATAASIAALVVLGTLRWRASRERPRFPFSR